MPQVPVETNDRMSLRIASEEKIIKENERLELTERDSLHVLDLLDNPAAPNDKLLAAAFALPKVW